MSGLPKVNINQIGGKLGRTKPTNDALAGMVLSGAAVGDTIALSEPKLILDLAGMDALGITEDNNPLAFHEITAFYNRVGEGAELWIMLVSPATNVADICLKTNDIARKLLDAADGKIRIFGVNRLLPDGYSLSNDECIDDDILQAKINLQELILQYRAAHKPFRGLLPGLGFDKDLIADLHDCQEDTHNAVAVVMWSDSESGQPAVGHTLGSLAALPVQRNIGRVKNGDVGLLAAYYPDGTPIKDLEAYWDAIYDKGYISLRKIYGRSGFFFTDDRTCCSISDDFCRISRGRTIDKADVLTYGVLSGELLDDVDTDDNGQIPASLIGSYQSEVEKAISAQMKGEISAVTAYIDPAQDFLGTDTMEISLKIRPKGLLADIEVDLSYENPFQA